MVRADASAEIIQLRPERRQFHFCSCPIYPGCCSFTSGKAPKRSCVSVLILGNAPPAPTNTGPALQALLNHVVAQELSAVDLNVRAAETISVRTLDGEEQIINTPGAGIFIQSSGLAPPGSLIITPDVEICAGIIHIVNKVLLTAPYQAVAPPGPSAGDTPMPTAQV